MNNVEVPKQWSQIATDILAQKYFRKAGVPQADGSLGRETSVKNCYLQAMQYLPKRPEAYFLISRDHEQKGEWQAAYTFAQVGLAHARGNETLPTTTQYLGEFVLLFEKAVAGWWIGRLDESISIFQDLLNQDIPDNYRKSIEYNLSKIDPNLIFPKVEI